MVVIEVPFILPWREVRKKNGRDPEPSALIIDSQSAKADCWAEDTDYDADKKIKGVKRHVVVDVLGLLIGIVVHSAAIQDRDGAKLLLLRIKNGLRSLFGLRPLGVLRMERSVCSKSSIRHP